MPEALLHVEGIYKSFAGVHALKNVSLSIMPGEIHCLAGENGCGKSTLIKIISGVYQPDAGSITFDGKKLDRITPIDAILMGIQVIYQDFSVFPNLTVMENLALNSELAAKRKIVNWKRMREIAQEAVRKINFDVDLDSLVGTLTVAQKQMVAISRALMLSARLIIMDEPTTALTRREVDALFRVILGLKEQGISVLFVSHKLNEVFEISERFTILRSGELVRTGETSELDSAKFTYYMTGRAFEDRKFVPENVGEEPLLEVRGLSLRGAFEDVSFSVRAGEIVGVTGLLDSGRGELALSLFGIRPADAGEILVRGKKADIRSPQDAVRHKIGLVPEDRLSEGLFLPRSIADNLIIAEIDRLTSGPGIFDMQKREAEVRRLVDEFRIATPNPDNAGQTLSGGNQQRVVLGKWLACDLDVLILSGPTVGVDIGSKHDIHAILRSLAKGGMGIVIISDDLPEVVANCSRVIVMKGGRVTARMDGGEATEQK
ncbi:MAG TPA: sugar ABC transporter ATP-binding protein, partial [Candidatus Limnocylindria bacterium]|nr:sugar ABC transporter ATP-binding protein [Candidatus Limnocylindria bacterium]